MRTTLIVLAAIATVTTGAMAFGGGGGGDGFGLGGPNLGDGYGRPSPLLGGPNGRRDYQFQYHGFAHKGGSWHKAGGMVAPEEPRWASAVAGTAPQSAGFGAADKRAKPRRHIRSRSKVDRRGDPLVRTDCWRMRGAIERIQEA